jgi:hypothetical protein
MTEPTPTLLQDLHDVAATTASASGSFMLRKRSEGPSHRTQSRGAPAVAQFDMAMHHAPCMAYIPSSNASCAATASCPEDEVTPVGSPCNVALPGGRRSSGHSE